MNLLEQQASNRRRTWLVMAAFVAIVVFIGAGVDLFIVGNGETFVPVASLVALGVSGGQAWWGLRNGDRSVLRSAKAVPVADRLAQAEAAEDRHAWRQLENVVEEMSIAAGLPRPAVWVIPDADPNAFATGRDPEHASIAVTEGLLRALNREELQGVVAHEMAHIRNYDIRLMTVVAALVGALLLLSDWATRTMRFGGGRRARPRGRKRDGGGVEIVVILVWVVAVALAPVVGRLLALAVSRRREYLADATGAELTRNPLALASALEKIERSAAPTRCITRGAAHLCIADPLGRRVNLREGWLADLWGTHPPMAMRVSRLRAMAFREQKRARRESGEVAQLA